MLNSDRKVNLKSCEFLKDKNKWNSAFFVDENNGKLIQIKNNLKGLKFEGGMKYGLLFCCDEKKNQQLAFIHDKNIALPPEKELNSLRNISMARAIVFWVAFSKIFFILSKIKRDVRLETDTNKPDYLVCPRSLKANLFQIALSINNFLKLRVSDVHKNFENETINNSSYAESINSLAKMRAEVSHFAEILSKYLKENEENENTVALITQLKELNEHEKYNVRNKKNKIQLNEIDTSTIFADKQNPRGSLEKLVKQRVILNSIFKSVTKMTSHQNLDVSKILYLLKLLKELIYSENSNLFQADTIYNENNWDADEEYQDIQMHYKHVYDMWRLVGADSSLVLDFDEQSTNWEDVKKEILDTQYMAELSFHEIVYSKSEEIVSDSE